MPDTLVVENFARRLGMTIEELTKNVDWDAIVFAASGWGTESTPAAFWGGHYEPNPESCSLTALAKYNR